MCQFFCIGRIGQPGMCPFSSNQHQYCAFCSYCSLLAFQFPRAQYTVKQKTVVLSSTEAEYMAMSESPGSALLRNEAESLTAQIWGL